MKRLAAAVTAASTVTAALMVAAPASADREVLLTEKYMGFENCAEIGSGQFCPSDANMAREWANRTQISVGNTYDSIKVEFTANANHCADMIAHVDFDGHEWGSNVVSPGGTDGGYEIPVTPGLHQIAYQAEGFVNGCNTGTTSAWGGTMRVYALYDD